MKEYLTSLVTAAAVAGVIGVLAPERGVGRGMKILLSALMLSLLLAPLSGLWGTVVSFPSLLTEAAEPYAFGGETAVIDRARQELEKAARDMLTERFSLERAAVSVSFSLDASDPGDIRILGITVTVRPPLASFLASDIRRYLSESFLCPVTVTEGSYDR